MNVPFTIFGYKSDDYGITSLEGMFIASLNPTSYKRSHAPTTESETETINNVPVQANSPKSKESFSVSFILDGTGAIPGSIGVFASVELLKLTCLEVNSEIHTSNYLFISWGPNLNLECKLKKMDINYTLFDSIGMAVRAEVNAEFEQYISPSGFSAGWNSPDMSHMVTVKSGDTLPLLCKQIYGDDKYYLQVAEKNNLIDLRNLKPGSTLIFPRLEK